MTEDFIQKKLLEIEREHNVKILLAIESGSRAWGFPSKNSDFDVRFVYARRRNDYLSTKDYRDVIEADITYCEELGAPLDMNGWDIRKALQLALKSNSVLLEWFRSPTKYVYHEKLAPLLGNFATKIANTDYMKGHYYKLMRGAWNQIEKNTKEVNLKLYCYSLRPSLALMWLKKFNRIPPMNIFYLCSKLIKDTKLEQEILNLISVKKEASEEKIIPRNNIIDSFISQMHADTFEQPKIQIASYVRAEADLIFRRIAENISRNKNKEARKASKKAETLNKKLRKAASNGSKSKAKSMIEAGANIDHKIHCGCTPLHLAALKGHLEIVRLLIKKGARINLTHIKEGGLHEIGAGHGGKGQTPLHFAAKAGHAEIVKLLVENGANINKLASKKQTPLSLAIQNNHFSVAEYLLENGADHTLSFLLHETIKNGEPEAVEFLIKRNLNINLKDDNGWAPLHYALGSEHPTMLELLINNGATFDIKKRDLSKVLKNAIDAGNMSAVRLLVSHGAKLDAKDKTRQPLFHSAIKSPDPNIFKFFIKHKIRFDGSPRKASILLSEACSMGNIEAAKLMIKRGANVDTSGFEWSTPLVNACYSRNLELVKLLIENSAKVNVNDKVFDETPLRMAASGEDQNSTEIVRLLIEHGADVNATDCRFTKALHHSTEALNLETSILLVEHGANVNAADEHDDTPLKNALTKGIVKAWKTETSFETSKILVPYLIEHGADVNHGGNDGYTPLHYAALHNSEYFTKLLLENGAKHYLTNKYGYTPLNIAEEKGYQHIVTIILRHIRLEQEPFYLCEECLKESAES